MSRSAKIRTFFGDRDYEFCLLIGQCVELQEITDCGLAVTLVRLQQFHVRDIKEVLRLGLIGGGMKSEDAFRLVERHVVSGEIGQGADVAYRVVAAAIAGVPDEKLGESKGEWIADPLSQTESSDMPTSTAGQALSE